MQKATAEFLSSIEKFSEQKKTEILSTKDSVKILGTTYFVSASGDDNNDGLTEQTAWKTTQKVCSFPFKSGDGVCFRRGDIFRGTIIAKAGVTYFAFGKGEKPKLYGYKHNLANESFWELVSKENNIYKLTEKIADCGTLVFDNDKKCSYKHIPSFDGQKFVCRNDWNKPFIVKNELTSDLDIYWHYTDNEFITVSSKGEDFPIPRITDQSLGDLYLKCDKGNPGKVFSSIEAVPRCSGFKVECNGVTIDNFCIKYFGYHGVAGYGDSVDDLTVSNSEIGWIGGAIQDFCGTDLNFPNGRHGEITRLGNGIEIYGGAKNYLVENNYIYQIYDAGATHQIITNGKKFVYDGITYKDNLIENCTYSIEYFIKMTDGDTESYMNNVKMTGNVLRYSGYGWGKQRHNKHTPAHIKGWSYQNFASNYKIENNIFDCSTHRLLHLVALKDEYCPTLNKNTFIQRAGSMLGQYGGNEISEPKIEFYDEYLDSKIKDVFGDKNAKVFVIQN